MVPLCLVTTRSCSSDIVVASSLDCQPPAFIPYLPCLAACEAGPTETNRISGLLQPLTHPPLTHPNNADPLLLFAPSAPDMQLHLLLVVSVVVGQAAAWCWPHPPRPFPSSPSFTPSAQGTMRQHRLCRSSLLLLASTSSQGGGNSSMDNGAGGSTSLGEGGGGVGPPPNIMPDASFANFVMQTAWRAEQTAWRAEDKTDKKLGEECDGHKW